MSIVIAGRDRVVRFAARELAANLQLATGREWAVGRAAVPTFRLGVCHDLGIAPPTGLQDGDDWIEIRREGNGYILTGSNARSVLFAVYRFLRETGFRWIRPGAHGAIVPRFKRLPAVAPIDERPSYYYRTICIEGACSFEHVRDLIDWQTKHGMNGYFIQFEYGAGFFKQWYEHRGNPHWKGQPLSMEKAMAFSEKVAGEITKRGLRFERVGHGWTSGAVGVLAEGWDKMDVKLSPARQQWLAELDGKRAFYGGAPLNTNLCYSNPKVRAKMTGDIARYAEAHPNVTELHFWLADGMNNQCECAACATARPADWYVDMLNELDERLTKAGLDTKIVFLIYVDLLWAPERSRIKNADRFILMFAPITRSYRAAFTGSGDDSEGTTPYLRNKLEMPKAVGANLEYLRQWQAQFAGRGFDYDYHLIWACYYDLNHYALARVLHEDIRGLDAIGLQGLNSVQNQRMSFPHNLLMDVMAATLWDKKQSFASIARRSFADAFGAGGAEAEAFFKEMSRLWQPFFEPVFLPAPNPKLIAAGKRNLKKMRGVIDGMAPLANRARPKAPDAIALSWSYLRRHLELLELMLPAYAAYLDAAPDCGDKFALVFDWLWRNEKELHPALDCATMIKVLKWRVHEAGEMAGTGHGGATNPMAAV